MSEILDLSGAKLTPPGGEQPRPQPPSQKQPQEPKRIQVQAQRPLPRPSTKGPGWGMWVFVIIIALIFGSAAGLALGAKPQKTCFSLDNFVRRIQYTFSKPTLSEFSDQQSEIKSFQMEVLRQQEKTTIFFAQDKAKITSSELDEGEIYLDLTNEKVQLFDTQQKVYYILPVPEDFGKFSKIDPEELGNFYDSSVKAVRQGRMQDKIVWEFSTKDKAGDEVVLWVDDCTGLVKKAKIKDKEFLYQYSQENRVTEDDVTLPDYAEKSEIGEKTDTAAARALMLTTKAQEFLSNFIF